MLTVEEQRMPKSGVPKSRKRDGGKFYKGSKRVHKRGKTATRIAEGMHSCTISSIYKDTEVKTGRTLEEIAGWVHLENINTTIERIHESSEWRR